MEPDPKDKPQFFFAESDIIDTMSSLLHEFMHKVLGLDSTECFVSDESSLSDFAPTGLPEDLRPASGDYTDLLEAWEAWVLDVVEARFGYRPSDTSESLVAILGAIERHRALLSGPRH